MKCLLCKNTNITNNNILNIGLCSLCILDLLTIIKMNRIENDIQCNGSMVHHIPLDDKIISFIVENDINSKKDNNNIDHLKYVERVELKFGDIIIQKSYNN